MTTQDSRGIRRPKISGQLAAILIIAALLIIAATLGSATSALSHGDNDRGRGGGTIAGQVTDPSGMPLEGVSVGIRKGPSAMTDVGGHFELTGVKQRKRIVVDFRKAGYVSTRAVTSLKVTPGSEDEDETDDDGGHKLERATLTRTMLPSGATQPLDTSAPGTIAEEGFKVTFPAGSLNAPGTVTVEVSPVDVSTGELRASPGDFYGRARDGSRVLLETFSLMDVSINQNGQPVNLRPGATATLEFLLPADTSLAAGETVPLWFYSETQGTWIEEGSGTVGTSTSDPGRLSVTGAVSHFTYWAVQIPVHLSEQTCVKGIVTDSDGIPQAGIALIAEGVSVKGVYYRTNLYALTNTAGEYCVMVRRESLVKITAYLNVGGATVTTSIEVMTPDTHSLACLDGDAGAGECTAIQTIALPSLSCISGDVRDSLNNPIAGFRVFSSVGTSATTDAAGAFCLGAPSGSVVSVHAPGYPSATVTTPNDEGSCAAGGCAVVAIRPAPQPTPTPTPAQTPTPTPAPTPTPSSTSCMEVSVTLRSDGSPAASATVRVFDEWTGDLLATGTTDAAGKVCFELLPADTGVFVNASRAPGLTGGAYTNTGAGGGSCASSGCLQVSITLDLGT